MMLVAAIKKQKEVMALQLKAGGTFTTDKTSTRFIVGDWLIDNGDEQCIVSDAYLKKNYDTRPYRAETIIRYNETDDDEGYVDEGENK